MDFRVSQRLEILCRHIQLGQLMGEHGNRPRLLAYLPVYTP